MKLAKYGTPVMMILLPLFFISCKSSVPEKELARYKGDQVVISLFQRGEAYAYNELALSVRITASGKQIPSAPDFGQLFKDLSLLDYSAPSVPEIRNGESHQEWLLFFETAGAGTVESAPLKIELNNESVTVAPFTVVIRSALLEGKEDLADPLEPGGEIHWLFYAFGSLFLILSAGALIFFLRKRGRAAVNVPQPVNWKEKVLELEQIEGDSSLLYGLLSSLLRSFCASLEGAGTNAMTDSQFRDFLISSPLVEPWLSTQLTPLLNRAEECKFSRLKSFDREQWKGDLKFTAEFIEYMEKNLNNKEEDK